MTDCGTEWSKGLNYCIYYTGLSKGPFTHHRFIPTGPQWLRELLHWSEVSGDLTHCFALVTMFETAKIHILEYLLHAKSNTKVMVHGQR